MLAARPNLVGSRGELGRAGEAGRSDLSVCGDCTHAVGACTGIQAGRHGFREGELRAVAVGGNHEQ